ncbi:MAG TPA: hypothetical protein VM934_11675 [Pyrinomonadaceae bacterium]|jgi:hypothetical protein|nr:hypothetical protein [Pyrinomonadaceae bacterium]
MKRLLASVKLFAIAAMMITASLSVSAQKFEGCDDFFHEIDEDGTHWDCNIDAASEEWCYYQCTSH